MKYDTKPSFSIGKGPRRGLENPVYNYMHSKNDKIDIREADLKRRNSSPLIGIGTDARVPVLLFSSKRRGWIKLRLDPLTTQSMTPSCPMPPSTLWGQGDKKRETMY